MRCHPRSNLKRGATLIAVFWIMAMMGLALVATMRIAKYQSDVSGSQLNGIEARQYAEMGINIAANPQVAKWDPLLNQNFGNGAGFQATISTEGGRFNINYLIFSEDSALIRLILAEWGIDLDSASAIADALIDWVDADDDLQINGAEYEYYEGLGFYDRPFNRPFYDLDEMRLVRGMDLVEAANPQWREWFTVWSSGGLDVTQAPARYLAVAAEGNLEDAVSLVELVAGPDGARNTEDDQPVSVAEALPLLGVGDDPSGLITARFNSQDPVTRIESVGFAGAARRKILMILSDRTQNPSILDRREIAIQ